MAVAAEKLDPEVVTFQALARENTGAHLLDSGGAYGRHHEKPEPPPDRDVVYVDDPTSSYPLLMIHTPAFLDAWFEIDREATAEFHEWAEGRDGSWLALMEAYGEVLGVEVLTHNTYNGESDLDQTVQFTAYSEDGDPYYGDGLVAVQTHNGCDVRGGYSRPVLARSRGYDYAFPMDWVVGFDVLEASEPWGVREYRTGSYLSEPLNDKIEAGGRRRVNGREVRDAEPFRKWRIGYTRLPSYELSEDVDRIYWFTWDSDRKTICGALPDGTTFKAGVHARGPGGEILV